MATSRTLTSVADVFPVGTSVAAYKLSNWATWQLPPSGTPVGVSDGTGTVQADGSLPFTGLADELDYMAYALVSGQSRYVRFSTRSPSSSSGTGDASATAKGVTKLSLAPASASNPIAVGTNDPRVGDPLSLAQGLKLTDTAFASGKGLTFGADEIHLWRRGANLLSWDKDIYLTPTPTPGQAHFNLHMTNDTHGVLFTRDSGGAGQNKTTVNITAADIGTDANDMGTTLGVEGYELTHGTIKVVHVKPGTGGGATTVSDQNAAAISIRANGVGTEAQYIFADSDDGILGDAVTMLQLRNHGSIKTQIFGDGKIEQNHVPVAIDPHRSSDCSTFDRLLAKDVFTLNPGNGYATRATCRKGQAFTKIRFCTGTTAVSGVTEVRLCVWNAAGTLLKDTGDVKATMTTAATMYEVALASSLTLTDGQQVWLGVEFLAGTMQARGISGPPAGMIFPLSPPLSRTNSYAGGTPGAMSGGGSANIPWLELVP